MSSNRMMRDLDRLGYAGVRDLVTRHGREAAPLRQPCSSPSSWHKDSTICATCGRAIGLHRTDGAIPGYAEAVWSWMLKHGGIPGFHGDYEDVPSAWVRSHLAMGCRVDYAKSELPELGHVSQFSDTESAADEMDALVGHLACTCGALRWEEWAFVGDITLGELMFQVLNEA